MTIEHPQGQGIRGMIKVRDCGLQCSAHKIITTLNNSLRIMDLRIDNTLEAINSLIRVADVESRGIIDSFRGMETGCLYS